MASIGIGGAAAPELLQIFAGVAGAIQRNRVVAVESKTTTFVVGSGHQDGVRVLVNPLAQVVQKIVVHEGVNSVGSGVVGVTGVVDTGSLDHDEVTLLLAVCSTVEGVEGGLSHLNQRRLVLGDATIDFVAKITCDVSVRRPWQLLVDPTDRR